MKSIRLAKQPAQKDNSVMKGDVRSYIKNYGLILDRFKWAAEDETTNLQYDNIQRYIAQLIDLLAFQKGETEIVKSIEAELKQLRATKPWDGAKFRIETIIQSAGSHGRFIFRGSNATLVTLAGVGTESGSLPDEYITFPPDDSQWLETRVQIDDWKTAFDTIYSSPSDNAIIELGFSPTESEETDFQLHFNAQVE